MSDAPELKPCPFCGSEANGGWFAGDYDVGCENCRFSISFYTADCESDDDAKAKAIAAWNTRAALREIKELEAKLAEAEARSEVLEELAMDVAADLYDGVAAHKIDQRIMDVINKLNDEEEEDQ